MTATTDGALKNQWYAWYVVLVLSIAAIVSYVDRQVINLLVEPIKADLGVSDTQISLIQGFSFAMFYAVLSVPIARLADAGNRVHVIIGGVICWSVATFSCGLAVGFWTLFAARVFVGAGEATLAPAGYSLLGDYFSKEKLPLAISVFTGSGFLGSGVALIIGAFVIDIVAGWGTVVLPLVGELRSWQLIFMLVALPSVLVVLLLVLVREPERKGVGVDSPQQVELRELFGHLKENRRIYAAIFFGFTLFASANFGIGAWVPTFFIRTYGWTASEIGAPFGAMAAVLGTAGVLSGGWLSSWLIQRGVATANFVVPLGAAVACVPFMAAFPLVGNAQYSLLLLGPVLFFGAMPFGTGTATLPQVAPNRMRAQVVAIYLLVANLLGFTTGPTLIAVMTDHYWVDPLLIRYSIASVAPVLVAVGVIIVASGLNAYGAYLRNQSMP